MSTISAKHFRFQNKKTINFSIINNKLLKCMYFIPKLLYTGGHFQLPSVFSFLLADHAQTKHWHTFTVRIFTTGSLNPEPEGSIVLF